MPDVLAHWTRLVRENPDVPALIAASDGTVWSRARLDASAVPFPSSLAGQRVAFALPNSHAWLAVFLGLLRVGAIPVPLDPSEPPAAQLALAAAAHAPFVWLNDHLTPTQCNPLGYTLPGAFLVKLTSGSTGRPQAHVFTADQMLADARQICASMGITADDINFAVIPFGHSYGLGNLVMPLLMQGTPIVCASVPLPHALAADIARWRPNVFPAVPALLRALAQADLPTDALSSLRTVISAGSRLSAETAGAFANKFNIRPHSFYGSSETGGIAYDRTGEATLAGRSVGTLLDGVTFTPADDGRFVVRSAAVHRDGSFSPADCGSLNDLGELVLHGRAGRLVKISGRRLDLGELEHALRSVPGVHDAFACAHPDNPEELAAVVATSLDTRSLRALLRKEFAAWKVPRRLVTIAEFPLTARGKPDTRALHALLLD